MDLQAFLNETRRLLLLGQPYEALCLIDLLRQDIVARQLEDEIQLAVADKSMLEKYYGSYYVRQ